MAIAAKPTFFPRFAINDVTDGGGRINVTEPPTDKKNSGWEYLEKPARDYMNWIHRGNYLWIDYFNQFWNSSHQFVINEMTSESGNGIDILQPLGIKTVPVAGTNLHVHQADSGASVQRFTNLTTTSAASHGTELGIDASEQGRIWNYENTDLVIGTNNIEAIRIKTNQYVGILSSTSNILAPLTVGNLGVESSADSQILISRSVDNTISGNGHAFSDSSYINRPGGIAYCSYDARIAFTGSYNYDHFAGFQSIPTWGSSGTLTNLYNFIAQTTYGAGTITNSYGFYVAGAATSGGTLTNKYAFASEPGAGNSGFGIISPLNPVHIQSTTVPQLRIGYDADSYMTIGVSDGGDITFTAGETTGRIAFITGGTDYQVAIYNGSFLGLYSSDNLEYGYIQHSGINMEIGTVGTNAGNIIITNTTECTGADTGALQVDGGVHIAKNLAVSGNYNLPLKVTDNTVSVSYSTGCAILSGGMGIQSNLYVRQGITSVEGNVTATAGNVVATAGYFQSGKGRWPTGELTGTGINENQIFDALDAFIPNTNDEMLVTGGFGQDGSYSLNARKAIRIDASTIQISGLQLYWATGNVQVSNFTFINGGTSSTYDIAISW